MNPAIDPSPLIASWHIVISGFLQEHGQPHGLQVLWKRLHWEHATAEQYVLFQTWNDNWRDTAEWIWRCSGENPLVKVYGYSWGAAGAMHLAKELKIRGLSVRAMVLSDPVYRHGYWLGQWRTFFRWFPINVPVNVHEVHWFRQENSWPRGHDLVADSKLRTTIHDPVLLEESHKYMDDAIQFYSKCLEVAA